jgi:hypothetical protein
MDSFPATWWPSRVFACRLLGQAVVHVLAQMLCDGLPLLVGMAICEGTFEAIENVVERFGCLRVIVAGNTFAGGSEQSFAFITLVEHRGFALRKRARPPDDFGWPFCYHAGIDKPTSTPHGLSLCTNSSPSPISPSPSAISRTD